MAEEEKYKESYPYKYGGLFSADYRPANENELTRNHPDRSEDNYQHINDKNTYFNRAYLNVDQYNYLASRINSIKKVRPLTFEDHYRLYPYRSGDMLVPKDLYTIEWEVDRVQTHPVPKGGFGTSPPNVYPNGFYWADSLEHAKEHYFRMNPAQSEDDIIFTAIINPNVDGSKAHWDQNKNGLADYDYYTHAGVGERMWCGSAICPPGQPYGDHGLQHWHSSFEIINGSRCGRFVEWEEDPGGPCLEYREDGTCIRGYGYWKSEGCCKRILDANGQETDECEQGGPHNNTPVVDNAKLTAAIDNKLHEIISVVHKTGWGIDRGGGSNTEESVNDYPYRGEYMLEPDLDYAGSDYFVDSEAAAYTSIDKQTPFWLNAVKKLNSSAALKKDYNLGADGISIPIYDQTHYPTPPAQAQDNQAIGRLGSWAALMDESGDALSDSIGSHTYDIIAEPAKRGKDTLDLKNPEGMGGQWISTHDSIKRKIGTSLHQRDLESNYSADAEEWEFNTQKLDAGDAPWGNLPSLTHMNLTKTSSIEIASIDFEIVDPLAYDQGIEYDVVFLNGKEYGTKDYFERHQRCSRHWGDMKAIELSCQQKCNKWDEMNDANGEKYGQFQDCVEDCVDPNSAVFGDHLPCSKYRFIDKTSLYFQKPNHWENGGYSYRGKRLWHKHFYEVDRIKKERGVGKGWDWGMDGSDAFTAQFSNRGSLQCSMRRWFCVDDNMHWSDDNIVETPDGFKGNFNDDPNVDWIGNRCRYWKHGRVEGFFVSKRHVNALGSCSGPKEETKQLRRKDMVLHPSFHNGIAPQENIFAGSATDYFGDSVYNSTVGYEKGVQEQLYNTFILPPYRGEGGYRGGGPKSEHWYLENLEEGSLFGGDYKIKSAGGGGEVSKGYYTESAVKNVHWLKVSDVQARAKQLGFHFEFRRLGVPYKMAEVNFEHSLNAPSQEKVDGVPHFARISGDMHYVDDKWTPHLSYQPGRGGLREYCQDEQFAGDVSNGTQPTWDAQLGRYKGLYEPQDYFNNSDMNPSVSSRLGCALRKDIIRANVGGVYPLTVDPDNPGHQTMHSREIWEYDEYGPAENNVDKKADFADAILGGFDKTRGWGNWGFDGVLVDTHFHQDTTATVSAGGGEYLVNSLPRVVLNDIIQASSLAKVGCEDCVHKIVPDTSPGGEFGPGVEDKHAGATTLGYVRQLGLPNKSHMSWWAGYDTHSLIFLNELDELDSRTKESNLARVGASPVMGGMKWKAKHENNKDISVYTTAKWAHHRNWRIANYVNNTFTRPEFGKFFAIRRKWIKTHTEDGEFRNTHPGVGQWVEFLDYEEPQFRPNNIASEYAETKKGAGLYAAKTVCTELDDSYSCIAYGTNIAKIGYLNWVNAMHGTYLLEGKPTSIRPGLAFEDGADIEADEGDPLPDPYSSDGVWPIRIENLVREDPYNPDSLSQPNDEEREGGWVMGYRNVFDTVPGDPKFHAPELASDNPNKISPPDGYVGRKTFDEQKAEGCKVPGADLLMTNQGAWPEGERGKFKFSTRGYLPHVRKSYQFFVPDVDESVEWIRPIGLGTVKHITEDFHDYDMYDSDFVKHQAVFSCSTHSQPADAEWGVPNWSRDETCDPVRVENIRLDNGGAQHTGNLIFGANDIVALNNSPGDYGRHWDHSYHWPHNALIEKDRVNIWNYDPTQHIEWPDEVGVPGALNIYAGEVWDNIELLGKNPFNWTVEERERQGFNHNKIQDWVTKYGCDSNGNNCKYERKGIPLPIGVHGRGGSAMRWTTMRQGLHKHTNNATLKEIIDAHASQVTWAKGAAVGEEYDSVTPLSGWADYEYTYLWDINGIGEDGYGWNASMTEINKDGPRAGIEGLGCCLDGEMGERHHKRFGYDCGPGAGSDFTKEGKYYLGHGGGGCESNDDPGQWPFLEAHTAGIGSSDPLGVIGPDMTMWIWKGATSPPGASHYYLFMNTWPYSMMGTYGFSSWQCLGCGVSSRFDVQGRNRIWSAGSRDRYIHNYGLHGAGGSYFDFINISLYDMLYHYDNNILLKVNGQGHEFNKYKSEMMKLVNRRNPQRLLYQDFSDYYAENQYNQAFTFGEEDYKFRTYRDHDYKAGDGYALSSLILAGNVNYRWENFTSSYLIHNNHILGSSSDPGSNYNMFRSFLRVGHDAINFGGRNQVGERLTDPINYHSPLEAHSFNRFGVISKRVTLDVIPGDQMWRPVLKPITMPGADPNYIPKKIEGQSSSSVQSLVKTVNGIEGGIGLCPSCVSTEYNVAMADNAVTSAVNFYIDNMINLSPYSTPKINAVWGDEPVTVQDFNISHPPLKAAESFVEVCGAPGDGVRWKDEKLYYDDAPKTLQKSCPDGIVAGNSGVVMWESMFGSGQAECSHYLYSGYYTNGEAADWANVVSGYGLTGQQLTNWSGQKPLQGVENIYFSTGEIGVHEFIMCSSGKTGETSCSTGYLNVIGPPPKVVMWFSGASGDAQQGNPKSYATGGEVAYVDCPESGYLHIRIEGGNGNTVVVSGVEYWGNNNDPSVEWNITPRDSSPSTTSPPIKSLTYQGSSGWSENGYSQISLDDHIDSAAETIATTAIIPANQWQYRGYNSGDSKYEIIAMDMYYSGDDSVTGTLTVDNNTCARFPDGPWSGVCGEENRVVVLEFCNSNQIIDEDMDVFLNEVKIGTLDMNCHCYIGGLLVASANNNLRVHPSGTKFPCPVTGSVSGWKINKQIPDLIGNPRYTTFPDETWAFTTGYNVREHLPTSGTMDHQFFDPNLIRITGNVLEIRSAGRNGYGSFGKIGIKSYSVYYGDSEYRENDADPSTRTPLGTGWWLKSGCNINRSISYYGGGNSGTALNLMVDGNVNPMFGSDELGYWKDNKYYFNLPYCCDPIVDEIEQNRKLRIAGGGAVGRWGGDTAS